jgi:hypothetical protein
MPELNVGTFQGTALPFYLTVKDVSGDLVPQPVGQPTIDIASIDSETHIRNVAVPVTPMVEIEPGRYFFVWRIAKDEPLGNHVVVLRAIIEDEVAAASDESFVVTSLLQNPSFVINIEVLENTGPCFPEVMAKDPKCKARPVLPISHFREVDIGLADFALEGTFRFGDFPNAVVDRRSIGRFNLTVGVGGIRSEDPGGGPAQRFGNPAVNTSYTARKRYRY